MVGLIKSFSEPYVFLDYPEDVPVGDVIIHRYSASNRR